VTASLFYRLLQGLTDVPIPLDTGDFRLMSRRVVEAFLAMPEQHRFVRGMVSWIGYRQEAIPYERAERFAGRGHYPLRKMIRLALDAITGFSVRPLRIANYLSVLLALAAFATLGYAVFSWLGGQVVPGWTSVMAVVLILGASQMLVLAIMGEYLGRLFVETKRRPLFMIESVTRDGQTKAVGGVAPERRSRASPGNSTGVSRPPPAASPAAPAAPAERQRADRG